jgi:hypothetical protein
MPQKTDLSKEFYILPLHSLIKEKVSFEKSHTKLEKICSEHRAELNESDNTSFESDVIVADHILELQKNIYDFFKKHALCINDINQEMIEKDDFILLFHIEFTNSKNYFFIPLAFISDEPNEKISQRFGLLFRSYEYWNHFFHIGFENKVSIQSPEKLDTIFTKQQVIDCFNQKIIIDPNLNIPGWGYYLVLCGKTAWELTRKETILSKEEKKLIILEKIEKEKRKFERLKFKHEGTKNKRERISEDVKTIVWRRDQGKCVECGSQEKLEFDHIIPVSKGGSNTARNLQLLCENCNRTKSDKI